MNKEVVATYAARLSRERGRPISPREAEADIVATIGKVSKAISSRYRFGYHDAEDIAQEATVEALEVINSGKYDAGRPLENFLYRHLRRRMSNFKRKHWARLERPCQCCNPDSPPAEPCRKFRDWASRNDAKRKLMRPIGMGQVSDEHEGGMHDGSTAAEDATINELRGLVDRSLPVELRGDYLRLLDGKAIPDGRRVAVQAAVAAILGVGAGAEGPNTEEDGE